MREQKVLPKEFEFYFSDLDNLLLVESLEDESVVIRFTKDNLTEKRKIHFIRQLSAEGFIPDQYQWYSGSTFGASTVTWVKDFSWVKLPEKLMRRTSRVMKLVIAGSCILWLALMRVVMVSPASSSQFSPKAPATLMATAPANSAPEKASPDSLRP